MSDRLAELQRQRALAQEQLAWFDREIARETGQPVPVAAVANPVETPTASADQAVKDAAAAREAEHILAQFQEVPQDAAKDAKQGCYLWFAFLMTIVLLSGAAIYFFYR
ncbi:MAG TPA: hypothetical protein VF388_01805 [Lacunisphaera sp.]